MSDIYTSLQVSPKKKRGRTSGLDDRNTTTPKKMRTAPPTPPPTKARLNSTRRSSLPTALSRLYNLQTALQHALSHALATFAIAPTPDSGVVRNVLNHISLVTYSGFSTSFEVDDLKRLCWLWEWDGRALEDKKPKESSAEDEDNPFLDSTSLTEPLSSDWTRGSMGLILSPATHFSKVDRRRVPAYGIGIEVEMDIDKDMNGGMAAVARWTAASEKRRSEFLTKLERWSELHPDLFTVPLAEIPELSTPKVSALTRTLASCSPSAVSPLKPPRPPLSPSRSPTKKSIREFAIPFPTFSSTSPLKKSTLLFPQTPSRRDRLIDFPGSGPPQTPSSAASSPSRDDSFPSTPVHQRGSNDSLAETPTSRRQALYERIRQRSLSASPTKKTPQRALAGGSTMTRDQIVKMSQDEMRRRCLLGRLGGVAESIWMLFSNPVTGGSSTPSRKRRALPLNDVITAVVKSSPVPISTAEANESITILIKLCPFFLKKLGISGGEWLEMPALIPSNSVMSADASPTKGKPVTEPLSPGRFKGKNESALELATRSPRRVKKEGGGLREVREIIRRELELDD